MLRWRLILGPVFAFGLAALVWLDGRSDRPGTYAALLALVVAGIAAGEIVRMTRAIGASPSAIPYVAGALLPVGACALAVVAGGPPAGYDPLTWLLCGIVLGTTCAFASEMRRPLGQGRSLSQLGCALIAVNYVGGLVGVLLALHNVRPTGASASLSGWGALVILVAIVKASDMGQYFVGRAVGKRKLAPQLSPGKTWEGALAGVAIAALVGGTALPAWGGLTPVSVRGALFGAVLATAGIFGDLAESLLKREAGVKDSSDWLPGFGGVLDLIDSLLFAGPLAYWAWRSDWLVI